MQSFAKYLGGSSANLAAGTARLGLRSSMLTRVGNEHMGRFVREALAREGVDVGHVATDPQRLTALVVLGIEGDGAYPHIFFRENCADMGVEVGDFDERYIASSRALAVTGTHLSTPQTRAAVEQAFRWARANDTRTILDIDYRPVLWKLTAPARAHRASSHPQQVTAALQSAAAAVRPGRRHRRGDPASPAARTTCRLRCARFASARPPPSSSSAAQPAARSSRVPRRAMLGDGTRRARAFRSKC